MIAVDGLVLTDRMSGDKLHRIALRVEWQPTRLGRGTALWVMLNPSIASAENGLDPTMRKVVGFSATWGYNAVEVVNLWTFVTPHPDQLPALALRNHAEADGAIAWAASDPEVRRVIVAWGAGGEAGRIAQITTLLRAAGHELWCLGRTKDGSPRHPGRIGYATPLELWSSAR